MLVQDNVAMHRFEAVDADRVVGFIDYEVRDGRHWLVHTEVDDAFRGAGVGDRLVAGTIEDLRARPAVVVPTCPFVAAWLRRHPDYDDLVDHETLRDHKRRQAKRADARRSAE